MKTKNIQQKTPGESWRVLQQDLVLDQNPELSTSQSSVQSSEHVEDGATADLQRHGAQPSTGFNLRTTNLLIRQFTKMALCGKNMVEWFSLD